MKFVYIAGPYNASGSYDKIDMNISVARSHAAVFAQFGIGFYCPHTHTAHFEVYGIGEEYYQELHDHWLIKSDAVFLLPGWENSKGALHEMAVAKAIGLPIFQTQEELIQWVESE